MCHKRIPKNSTFYTKTLSCDICTVCNKLVDFEKMNVSLLYMNSI